eukprot:664661-Hanusia_phi.AAC.1
MISLQAESRIKSHCDKLSVTAVAHSDSGSESGGLNLRNHRRMGTSKPPGTSPFGSLEGPPGALARGITLSGYDARPERVSAVPLDRRDSVEVH